MPENIRELLVLAREYSAYILMGVMLWLLIWVQLAFRVKAYRVRGIPMDEFNISKEEKVVVADAVTDGLLQANVEGKLSDKQLQFWNWVLADIFGLPDLLPRANGRRQQVLIETLKANRRKRTLNGKTPPVPLPKVEVEKDQDVLHSILHG